MRDKMEKWTKHCRFGKFVENTKIIPTKVFLMENKWSPYFTTEAKYTLQDLLDYSEE